MTDNIPVIFFHVGNPQYLRMSLMQAKERNPDSRIILFGDQTNNNYSFVEHINIRDYETEASKFSNIYEHLSTNNKHFELLCFNRWFVINEYAKKTGLEKFFYCDSDVMLYCDITEEYEKFKDCRFTLTHNISAGIGYFNDMSAIDEYCSLCMDIFSKKEKFWYDKCCSHYADLQRNNRGGGVCDMTVWAFFRTDTFNNPGIVGETSQIINNSAFDHNINQQDGYEMENGVKKIYWRGEDPYCKNIRLDRLVKFNCLHFQGLRGKQLLEQLWA